MVLTDKMFLKFGFMQFFMQYIYAESVLYSLFYALFFAYKARKM